MFLASVTSLSPSCRLPVTALYQPDTYVSFARTWRRRARHAICCRMSEARSRCGEYGMLVARGRMAAYHAAQPAEEAALRRAGGY